MTNNKSQNKIFTILKWFLGVIFILSAIRGLQQLAPISAIAFLIAGLVLIPPTFEFIKAKLPFLENIKVKTIAIVALVMVGASTMPKGKKNQKDNIATEAKKQEEKYAQYLEASKNEIANLSADRKEQRAKLYSQLKSSNLYKKLVDSNIVSLEFMPYLNGIANGITLTDKEGFGLDEDVFEQLDEDEAIFTTSAIGLSLKLNGGIPIEIINVFEAYKDKYRMMGVKGLNVDGNGTQENILYDFDLSPFFGMIDPTNKNVLDAIYEARNKGISDWNDTKESLYPYLSSKKGYMKHLSEVYPESQYLVQVDFEVSVKQLYAEYNANEVSADEKYKGKRLAITGIIRTIGKDALNNPYLGFEADFLKNVNCYFSQDANKILSQLSKGNRVTVVGKCSGMIITAVVMKDCELN